MRNMGFLAPPLTSRFTLRRTRSLLECQHLFDQPDRERHRELDCVADQIAVKFGKRAIRRGAGLTDVDE